MKAHHTDLRIKVVIVTPNSKKISYINPKNVGKLEAFLEKFSEEDGTPVAWEILAKERLEKYKKAGLVLRGIRYRENMSQKELAKKSGISQNEISKIENGKRVVGKKVATKLAEALNIDYRLLIED
jgi:DNA-binding XRE family transcriptional regulator